MKFYDLFAGIGGFRLGLERCGFECVGSCEIDKYAKEIYKKNFGDYPEERDIREMDASKLPDFDILTAGFPCQSFSIAGKRMGFNDTRVTLFFEIARIAAEKRPEILFLENVKGLLNHNRGRTFGTIINTLYELGYDVEWQVINGKYFVPQNRERVFIIGHNREKSFRKIFPIIKSNQRYDESQIQKQEKRKWFRSEDYSNTLDTGCGKSGGTRTVIAIPINSSNINSNGRKIKTNNEISFTLDTSNNTGVYDGYNYRRFSPLECERLMGFPDKWTELGGISDTQRYKMLGNSVIPQIIEMLGNSIKNNSYN